MFSVQILRGVNHNDPVKPDPSRFGKHVASKAIAVRENASCAVSHSVRRQLIHLQIKEFYVIEAMEVISIAVTESFIQDSSSLPQHHMQQQGSLTAVPSLRMYIFYSMNSLLK